MTVPLESAAKYICEAGNWRVTNLQLQKILYLAQMVHLGRTGRKLVDVEFEAWDYGPVAPELYHRMKGFGAEAIPEAVFWAAEAAIGSDEEATLRDACLSLIGKTGGELIRNTHWSGGAWSKKYIPGASIRISVEDMLYEFRNRSERAAAAA